jgi:valyl-tRNA synthetase
MSLPNPLADMKSWDKSFEQQVFRRWEEEGIGSFDLNSSKPLFIIDTPPPYPSGRPWHVGGASHYAQIDMIARSARMRGFEVMFPIGLDRNGLPVELYTEKKYGVSIKSTPREKFIELCRVALDDLEQEMLETFKLMGLSGDYKNKYRTDGIAYRALTQATFISQWKDGRIYEGTRPTNYCVDCGTTIADAEIVYAELHTKLVYFDFEIKGEDKKIPIASTRPELICSCQAVIVNPEDERYSSYVGKIATLPLYGREVKVFAHNSARPEFGTGAVMVCSYGDYNDVQLFRELGLQETIAIDTDGRMLPVIGNNLGGLRVKQARNAIIDLMQKQGLVKKVEEILHRTPLCERSKTPIEIIPMDEFYLKVVDVKDDLRRIAKSLRFHPEMHRTILQNWIEVALDWPISRRRFYGTEVPVWYCKKCNSPYLPPPGPYYQPWKDPPPGNPKCAACNGSEFVGDVRTFDTWMDSSISALFVTKYTRDDKFHWRTYPATIRPQGKDIIRTWLHYSILRCWQISGKVPWSDVWITGWGLDEKGERMSKSKGNVIDPIVMLNRYGAENFRLWIASEVSIGSDYSCSEQKIASPGKFLTKLWNISRFIAGFPLPKGKIAYAELAPSDRWILAELSELTRECLSGYEDFNFFIPANRIRDFTWNTFAAHYVELAKARAYGEGFSETESASARFTLHECLKSILLLLAPITPFITETIWNKIYSQASIHRELFPDKDRWNTDYQKFEKALIGFNSQVWNEKKSKGLSLKDPLKMDVPEELKEFAGDLAAMHNLVR